MEELKIELEVLILEKAEIKVSIYKEFEYGRFPTDDTFIKIKKRLDKLIVVQVKINVIQEMIEAIQSNKNNQKI